MPTNKYELTGNGDFKALSNGKKMWFAEAKVWEEDKSLATIEDVFLIEDKDEKGEWRMLAYSKQEIEDILTESIQKYGDRNGQET